jgi:hypothetical protein
MKVSHWVTENKVGSQRQRWKDNIKKVLVCDANWVELAQNSLELLNAAFDAKSLKFHICSLVLDRLDHGVLYVL